MNGVNINQSKSSFFEENEYTKLYIDNGILYEEYKPKLDYITLEVAKRIVNERHSFCKGKCYPILVDTAHVRAIDRHARIFFSSPLGLKYLTAGAIVTHNTLAKLSGNIYLLLNRPKIPAKSFLTIENATKWLQYFRFLN